MSANKYRNHVLVLPEDRANHAIAHGFQLHASVDLRTIQVLPSPGGWAKVRDAFSQTHIAEMKRHPRRYMVLLVDFDQNETRREQMKAVIPTELADRVFVVGVWSEPEDLRTAQKRGLEQIGRELATECRDGTRRLWSHRLLQHNATELQRMTNTLKPFLFQEP